MNHTLSVVIITKNEEANIRQCLDGVKWADEIVIVDDMSTDRTVSICREYTDKIYTRKMEGFGAQKQYAIDQATCEWVLSLDADERLSPELKDHITRLLAADPRYSGYKIWRKTFYLGAWIRYCGWYNPVVRFFKRGSGRTDLKYVHEEILITGEVGEIKSPLLHYSYNSIEQHVNKIIMYSDYDSRLLFEKGIRISNSNVVWYCLIKPGIMAMRKYIVQGGILEGPRGLFISAFTGMVVFLNYAKLWTLQREGSAGTRPSQVNSTDKIGAVIVTYNNAAGLEGLLKDLAAQTRHPDEVIVIDNHGEDGTSIVIERSPVPVRYVRLDTNLGSAGGFREGIRLACQKNDLVWLLDDDVIVEHNALEFLMEGICTLSKGVRVGAVRSAGDATKGFSLPVKASSFAWRGTLIRSKTISGIGLPRSDYFLYGEDAEYSMRMVRKGYSIYYIPSSHVIERPAQIKMRMEFFGRKIAIHKDPFRLYYANRNQFNVFMEYKDFMGLALSFIYAVKIIAFFGIFQGRGSGQCIAAIVDGIRDGMRGRLGVNERYAPMRGSF